MNKAIFISCCAALSMLALNDASAEEETIRFFSPADGGYIDYGESSFSAPRPVVVIDPAVLGSSRDHPGNSTIEQIGPDVILVRITGRVYDFVSDIVANRHADIESVEVNSNHYGSLEPVPVANIEEKRNHPDFDAATQNLNNALRPYAFSGHFDTGELELRVHTGYNGINITATNYDERSSTATLNITASVNRDENKYDIEIDSNNGMDGGLYNPVLVHIYDDEVTPDNVTSASALLNGKSVGLRFINGQLQLDRPIIGLGIAVPTDEIPNIVNVTGDPDRFLIRYKGRTAEFNWSYTR